MEHEYGNRDGRSRGGARGAALAGIMALAVSLLGGENRAQLPSPPRDPDILNSLDSLKRVITVRILSDADKKEIRSCNQEKSAFLRQCRAADTANAGVDALINEAKLRGANQGDPAIQALMEKKFAREKACDDAFNAKPRGKQCLAGENRRRIALEKALKGDSAYQGLLRRSESTASESL